MGKVFLLWSNGAGAGLETGMLMLDRAGT